MKTHNRVISLVFLFVFVQLCARNRQEILITLPGVQQVIPADLNHDSHLDLIVLHRSQPIDIEYSQRIVSIFYYYEGGYSSEPNTQLKTIHNEITIDCGDINEDGLNELIFIRPDGVWIWQPMCSDTCQKVLGASSLFIGPDALQLHHWRMLLDINEDCKPEIVLPAIHGYRFFGKDSSGQYKILKTCIITEQHTVHINNGILLQTGLPRIQYRDMNNDGKRDLVFLQEDRLECFFGPFPWSVNSSQPSLPDYRFRFAVDNINPSELESLAPVKTDIEIEDLNEDGFADVILSRASRASLTRTRSQLQLYYHDQDDFKILPDQVLTADNFYGEHIIADLNQDNRPDLVLLHFPIGLIRAVGFLITRSLKYGYDIYLMKPDGHYNSLPDQKLRFTRHTKIRNLLKLELSAITDWNGDKRPDLLANVTQDQIIGFIQKETGDFPGKPNLKIKIPVSSHHWIGDLNNDSRSDIVLWYPETGLIRCLISGDL